MRRALFFLTAILCAGPAAAAVFPCSEAGLDAAIAAAHDAVTPDPGPHALDCAPGASFEIVGRRSITADLALDGRGVTIECVDPGPGVVCSPALRAASDDLICGMPVCNPPVFGPGPSVTLERITGYGALSGIESLHGASLFLREIRLVAAPGDLSAPGVLFSGYGDPAQLEITDSTIEGPVTFGHGTATIARSLLGKLNVGSAASMSVLNATISGVNNAGTLDLRHTTVRPGTPSSEDPYVYTDFTYETCGFDTYFYSSGDLTVTNSIFDGPCLIGIPFPNDLPSQCVPDPLPPPATLTSQGGNLERGGDTCTFGHPSDQVSVTAGALNLGPLADHGGPTATHALLPGSVAIDAGVSGLCASQDQRGAARPEPGGTSCDAGAYEFGSSVLAIPALGVAAWAATGALLGLVARRVRRRPERS